MRQPRFERRIVRSGGTDRRWCLSRLIGLRRVLRMPSAKGLLRVLGPC